MLVHLQKYARMVSCPIVRSSCDCSFFLVTGPQAVRYFLLGKHDKCDHLPRHRTGLAYDERMRDHVCHDQDMIWEIIRSGEMPDGDG